MDMSAFKLTAWTDDPDSIPKMHDLKAAVAHPSTRMELVFGSLPPFLWKNAVLTRWVLIHLRSVIDCWPHDDLSGASSPLSNVDSGSDGNPDRSYGASTGINPYVHGFICRRGVIDGELPQPDETDKGGGGRTHVAPMHHMGATATFPKQKQLICHYAQEDCRTFPKASDDSKHRQSKVLPVRHSAVDQDASCQ